MDDSLGSSTSAATPGSDGSDEDGSSDSGPPPTPPPPPSACAEPTEVIGAPQTIGEAVDLVNALPRPLTLDCFLERLERPLALNATFSTVSLQPAVGAESPRIFIFYGDLIMSVAIDGDGRDLLEFGEIVAPTRSVKGELEFPVTEPMLTTAAATEQVLDESDGTKCRLCHGFEEPSPLYELAFESDALRFRDDEVVELEELRGQYLDCVSDDEPERCARLAALFGFGAVVDGDFPGDLQTIYDYE